MQGNTTIRLRILSGIVLLIGCLFISRLYFLQVVHGDDFRKEGDKQYVHTLPNIYDRGSIYFTSRDGKDVTAATINTAYVIAIDTSKIADKTKTYDTLNQIFAIDRKDFMAKADKPNDPYEEIAHRVPEDKADLIKAKNLDGVQLFRETWRYYPGGPLAAQVLGFVGNQGEVRKGQYGLEAYYDDVLERHEENVYVNFFAELFTNLGDTLFDSKTEGQGDLKLTIEPTVQSYLETELAGVMNEWHSDQTGGIIMDPKTGAIYAMAINPTFDPNEYGKVKNVSVFTNSMVQNVYEMGSIVKPLTMAAGLDAHVVSANTTYNDTGKVTMNKKTFGNFDGVGRGPGTTMQTVLSKSLNTGVAFVVGKLGNKRFADYMLQHFRMGEETGVDLPGERQGLMTNLSSNRDIEYATASFGQGIALSPINMAASLAILGNGGTTITPHVVDEIRYTSGKVKKFTPTPGEQAITKETGNEITRMLVRVVDEALLNGSVKIPEYSVAAKTGTAQISRPRELGGGYYEDRYMHTFFGYFPAYDPKFIVFLYTYYPKDAEYASHTLTMPFIRTTKFLLNYYNIPPDRDPNAKKNAALIEKNLPLAGSAGAR